MFLMCFLPASIHCLIPLCFMMLASVVLSMSASVVQFEYISVYEISKYAVVLPVCDALHYKLEKAD